MLASRSIDTDDIAYAKKNMPVTVATSNSARASVVVRILKS
jgi:hypothetical protein